MSDYGNNDEVHPDAPAGGGGPGHFHTLHSPHPAGHHTHDASHAAHHYAHAAHETHLAAEATEFLAEQFHHVAKLAGNLSKAKEIMAAHSQMAVDLKLMRRAMRSLENAMTKSGKNVAAKLAELKAAYAEAETVFNDNRAAAAAASQLFAAEHATRVSLKGMAKIKLGEAIMRFEHTLGGSVIGRGLLKTGRIAANPKFVKGLLIVGAAVEGVAGWLDSNAETTGGKAANAVLAAGGGALVMANPVVAGVDAIAPKGYKLSEVYQGTAGGLTAIAEGIAMGDENAMAKFHERSKQGDYGKAMQAASEAGDYWAQKGLLGGLSEFKEAVKYSIESW